MHAASHTTNADVLINYVYKTNILFLIIIIIIIIIIKIIIIIIIIIIRLIINKQIIREKPNYHVIFI